MTDEEYMAEVANLPCCICEAFGEPQMSPTQVHHWICGRGSIDKRTPDKETIPLCEGHHQGMFDTSKLAIHNGSRTWAEKYGPDHEYVLPTQDKITKIMRNRI